MNYSGHKTTTTDFVGDPSSTQSSPFEVKPRNGNKRFVHNRWPDVAIASMPPEPELRLSTKTKLEKIIDPSVRPLLTDRVKETLTRLYNLLRFEARRSHISINRIEVSGFFDPEEDVKQVVVTLWVAVSAKAALAFWDSLARSLDDWLDFLPDTLARVAGERIAIAVRWDING